MTEPEQNLVPRLEMSEELQLLAALQRDIAARLRSVCSSMDETEFESLVREIAAMKIKYGPESEVSGSLRNELHNLVDPGPQKLT
jgi:hypothetical protein